MSRYTTEDVRQHAVAIRTRTERALAHRLQVADAMLGIAESEGLDPEDDIVQQVINDLKTFSTLMSNRLGLLTEWQVSAFHDQFNTLTNRLNTLTNTKEN